MPQLKISAANFDISSLYACNRITEYTSTLDGYVLTTNHISESASEASKPTRYVDFPYSFTGSVTITGAKVCATLSSPADGAKTLTVNGRMVSAGSTVAVDVDVSADGASVYVPFVFQAANTYHFHTDDANDTESSDTEYVNNGATTLAKITTTYKKNHVITLYCTNVYLLIDYVQNYESPQLVPFTHLYEGESFIKAAHMTELHTNINRVRVARFMPEFAFSPIVAMVTPLSMWSAHVREMRTAMDEIAAYLPDKAFAQWIAIDANSPNVCVMNQLQARLLLLDEYLAEESEAGGDTGGGDTGSEGGDTGGEGGEEGGGNSGGGEDTGGDTGTTYNVTLYSGYADGAKLTIRATPSTNGAQVTSVSPGTQFIVVGALQISGFRPIIYNGAQNYAYATYIETTPASNAQGLTVSTADWVAINADVYRTVYTTATGTETGRQIEPGIILHVLDGGATTNGRYHVQYQNDGGPVREGWITSGQYIEQLTDLSTLDLSSWVMAAT